MIAGIVASQLIGAFEAGGGAPSVAVLEYLGAHYDATNQTTYTFAGIDFGVAAAGRVIIVAFKLGSDDGGSPINTVTIGGVTATEVTTATFANIVPIALFYAEVPTGTTGNVVITGANSPQNCAMQVWAAYDTDPEPHNFFSAASNGSGTSMGSVVDVPDGGFLVAAWGANHADLNASWTGATEEAERVTGEQTFEAASDQQMAEETERSVSVSHAAATHRRMVCATWAPGEGGGGGDVTDPTITSSDTASVAENATLSHALTADESVTWSLVGGADQARFEISGSTLRWLSNGTKDFETPDDADTNNTYVVTVRATDTALNTTDQTITVTVTDVAEGGATPVYRSSNVIAGALATTLELPYPAGIAADDILLVLLSSDVGTGTNLTTPTDFTALDTERDEGTTFVSNVFWKRATGSETGTLTIAQSSGGGGSDVLMGTMHAVSGCVASGDPIEDTAVAQTTGTSLTSGTVTTLGANRLIAQLWAVSDNLTGAAQAPYTENYEIVTGVGTDGAHAFCSAEKASAGVSDVDARTIGASTPMIVFTLALKP